MYRAFCKTEIQILGREKGIEKLAELAGDPQGTVVVASVGTVQRLGLKDTISEKTRYVSCFSANPTVEDLHKCLTELDGYPVTRMICVGGGSAMDMGKALCAMLGMEGGVPKSYDALCGAIEKKEYQAESRAVELIAVPTTAGTGSEVTQWATVWDKRNGRKLSVDMPALAPDLAVIVPQFTVDLPARLTLSTGLDAMAQAMESFWAKARSPLSQALALDGIRYIYRCLPLVLSEPKNVQYREGMCMGALLSGLAFSKTRTTACHSISYPITMRHGIEHGFAVAVTLEEMARINQSAVPEIESIYEIFGGLNAFQRWMATVIQQIQPLRLSAMGIREVDLAVLAENAFTQGRMDNNPVTLSQMDVEEILHRVF